MPCACGDPRQRMTRFQGTEGSYLTGGLKIEGKEPGPGFKGANSTPIRDSVPVGLKERQE